MAGYGYGISVSGTRALGQSIVVPPPIPVTDLALWLKADAGVSKLSYNYASQIIISGTSTPSFNGTYTAIGTPGYTDGIVDSYSFSAPSGKQMNWNSSEVRYELFLSGSANGGFQSSDGINWGPIEEYISSITITGFTGIYSDANGTYNETSPNSNRWDRVGGGKQFFIDGDGLRDTETEELIATPPANYYYSGSWTPTNYVSSVTLTGAGTTAVNGTYTRTDSQFNMIQVQFTASGGRTLNYDGGEDNFYTTNGEYGSDPVNLVNWSIENGDSPAPTGSIGTSARSVGSPTSTSVIVPSGSISGSVTTSTVNTDNVTGWADQSGNGRNVSEGGETTPSFEVISGKQFISLGTNSYLNNSGNPIWPIDGNIDYGTIIIVARFTIDNTTNNSLLFYHEPTLYFARGYPNGDKTWITIDDDIRVDSQYNLNANTNYLLEATFTPSIGILYKNGVFDATGSVNSNYSGANFNIGGAVDPLKIAEVVVYNRVLTTPERQQVEAYLNAKYAIY
jgi:hypothetical protein